MEHETEVNFFTPCQCGSLAVSWGNMKLSLCGLCGRRYSERGRLEGQIETRGENGQWAKKARGLAVDELRRRGAAIKAAGVRRYRDRSRPARS